MARRITTDGQDANWLIVISGVLVAVILITGYLTLTHKPEVGVYDAKSRHDLTSLIKTVSKK